MKQLSKSPWEAVKEKYPPRTRVHGTISGITAFGIFVKLEDDVEGLVHISEVSRNRIEKLEDHFKTGDPVEAVVLDVDIEKKDYL
ncbi:MAG: S1 RNA-binding domain-containing protein [Candidatus Moduliflexus flocculans]|nr:S1 RNA-binding domain-containing protein [Candidatus Moduliflexus flocculans]